ncbi:MAG: RluA family pseudouridine synthase [Deltaproteobacteria bacterium]|nr:RluA family pseudouridine synthase [Deltaproteobacteria bacterium]
MRSLSVERWIVAAEEDGTALASFVRSRLTDTSWNEVKRLVSTGKVLVDGERRLDAGHRLGTGQEVELRMAAPRPREPSAEVRIAYEDAHVVVIDKPAGVSSVPYEKKEGGTAMDLIRDAWRRMGRPATKVPLHVVHRIDKETSGLVVFAKTKRAERALAAQFRAHSVQRSYLCVAHGHVASQKIESFLVDDRGDGLRGSARFPGQGKRAITHVRVIQLLPEAALCEVRLETGKTHQIRIHLSEIGHPLVGEKVYIRDYLKAGKEPIPASRLMLHAATLGFRHPVTEDELTFESSVPEDFQRVLTALRKSPA